MYGQSRLAAYFSYKRPEPDQLHQEAKALADRPPSTHLALLRPDRIFGAAVGSVSRGYDACVAAKGWYEDDATLVEKVADRSVYRAYWIRKPVDKVTQIWSHDELQARHDADRKIDAVFAGCTTKFDAVVELNRESKRLRVDLPYVHPDSRVVMGTIDSHQMYCMFSNQLRPSTEPREALAATLVRLSKQHDKQFVVCDDGEEDMPLDAASPPRPAPAAAKAKPTKVTCSLDMEVANDWILELVSSLKLCGLNAK